MRRTHRSRVMTGFTCCEHRRCQQTAPLLHPSEYPRPDNSAGTPGAQAHDSQFFWMMQSPPAAFSALHIFVAFSADAKGPTRAR